MRGTTLGICSPSGVLLIAVIGAADANTLHTLYAFKGGNDGSGVAAGDVMDRAGNLYGSTENGGGSGNGGFGWGTVYKFASDGTESVLYAFQGGNDGWLPVGSVTLDKSENVYGTTSAGGGSGCSGYGCGTVFRITPNGTETILYSFTGASDGAGPWAGVVADKAGNLFGTTSWAGAYNIGTIYKLAPDRTFTLLHSFTGGSDGGQSVDTLILGRGGDLYGTTTTGGNTSLCGGAGCGVVFKVTAVGAESVLYTFSGGDDGGGPTASLAQDGSGNLYGTTTGGGSLGYGTVFKLAPDGTETVLHAFGAKLDGQAPEAGVVLDGADNLYGTTPFGGLPCGQFQCGIVFQVTPAGKEKVLYRFKGGNDGAGPGSGDALVLKRGELYGTTSGGGAHGDGTIFKIRK